MGKISSLLTTMLIVGCFAKGADPNDAQQSFVVAKQAFDDGDHELAIAKLGAFRARFPYNKQATEAELLIADATYELGHYPEALVAYQRFARLHPRHPRRAYALFRVGQSHWVQAPTEIDREQNYTSKALVAWQKLIAAYPTTAEANKARQLLDEGERRVAGSFAFIADFYCAQKVYHACAYRHIKLAQTYARFRDIAKGSYHKAAEALEQVLQIKRKQPQANSNLYLRSYSSQQLALYIKKLRAKAG